MPKVLVELYRSRDRLLAELADLERLTGEVGEAQLRKRMAAPLLNPFSKETMVNTNVEWLRTEATDRLNRHVTGNWLNADKGFRYRAPTCSQTKEQAIVIGPVPRKEVQASKKELKRSQQTRWALKRAGVVLGPWDLRIFEIEGSLQPFHGQLRNREELLGRNLRCFREVFPRAYLSVSKRV